MKRKLLALAFVMAGSLFAQVSLGIRIGPPPAPRVVRVRPVAPGPGFTWVEGYWYPVSGRYRWHEGYWSRPPYAGAHWVAPRHDGHYFIDGHWDGARGEFRHDHRWDRDRDHRDGDRFDRH
ncbi:MAG TPA: YXWGXW repeat-containing protein [Bryobacteraceae bacterium]|nr:YXWGXW repeat-containing protein [Bryobacteraceae bacterium]